MQANPRSDHNIMGRSGWVPSLGGRMSEKMTALSKRAWLCYLAELGSDQDLHGEAFMPAALERIRQYLSETARICGFSMICSPRISPPLCKGGQGGYQRRPLNATKATVKASNTEFCSKGLIPAVTPPNPPLQRGGETRRHRILGLCCVALLLGHNCVASAQGILSTTTKPILLTVDARDILRRIVTSKIIIPAQPGPLTLHYPKWIPGTHSPLGPITKLAGIKLQAQGKLIPWKRNSLDLYAFDCVVPSGADAVEAELLYVVPAHSDPLEVSLAVVASRQMAIINWNALVLYPDDVDQTKIDYHPKLILPPDWSCASSLTASSQVAGIVVYAPATLERLIDSPVLAGAHLKTIMLTQVTGVPHFLDVATEDGRTEVPADLIAGLTQVANEAGALFGGRGYHRFHFLLGISDGIPNFGLEHHECTVNTISAASLGNDPHGRWWPTFLLAHEYVHSWNGKHRRPADMLAANFHADLKTDLLWVYEGLTQYLGLVLDARSGFWTKQQFRDELAVSAGGLEVPSRRAWRSVLDTAIAEPLSGSVRGASWRTQSDFYYESVFIWLEADTIIRKLSHGQRSLDDFCQSFFNKHNGKPVAIGYTFDDVVAGMNAVQPYNWADFFKTRLESMGGRLPLAGIENAGWKLVFTDEPCAKVRGTNATDLSASIGLLLTSDGTVSDVVFGSPAWDAGIGPGMKLLTVNKNRWSPDAWRQAVASESKNGGKLTFEVEGDKGRKTLTVAYAGGERFPRLQADPARFDMLDEIIRPRTPAVPVNGK
jgi:predicted metalloprotease with PDZ domain